MVARDSSCIFPNIIDPFDWFIPSLLDELVQKSYLNYILSGGTQGSLVSAKEHGRPAATPAFAPNKSDPSVRVLPNLRSALI
jgi:hypothetical protein